MIDEGLIRELNEIAGRDMEGSLCYLNEQVPENYEFYDFFETKRKNIVSVASKYNRITEIGFNAGHSAALMLTANPNLHLTSVDIGYHSYTVPCANVIQRHFPDRHNLILKNSSKIDKHEIQNSEAVLIDGGHLFENCILDIAICIAYCKPGTLLVIDDYRYKPTNEAVNRFLSSFVACDEYISDDDQAIFYLK